MLSGPSEATMMVEIHETVLSYEREQLEAWIAGDKSLVPAFAEIPPATRNQPRYHFGEMLVLRHYHENGGWRGYESYALGPQYPGSQRRAEGRQKVEDVIPADRLARFRELRSDPAVARVGRGEPDLFLYKEDGTFKFVEVKKATDRLRQPQLICIAHILAVLQCEVDIVYVREERQYYRPKTYRFDLDGLTGERVTQEKEGVDAP